jgi:hypothetical protein
MICFELVFNLKMMYFHIAKIAKQIDIPHPESKIFVYKMMKPLSILCKKRSNLFTALIFPAKKRKSEK